MTLIAAFVLVSFWAVYASWRAVYYKQILYSHEYLKATMFKPRDENALF